MRTVDAFFEETVTAYKDGLATRDLTAVLTGQKAIDNESLRTLIIQAYIGGFKDRDRYYMEAIQ